MRYTGLLSPVRHYVDFGYPVLFKGNGLAMSERTSPASSHSALALFAISARRLTRLAS